MTYPSNDHTSVLRFTTNTTCRNERYVQKPENLKEIVLSLLLLLLLFKKYYNKVTHAKHRQPGLPMQKEQEIIRIIGLHEEECYPTLYPTSSTVAAAPQSSPTFLNGAQLQTAKGCFSLSPPVKHDGRRGGGIRCVLQVENSDPTSIDHISIPKELEC